MRVAGEVAARSTRDRAITAHNASLSSGLMPKYVVVALVRARIPRMVVTEHEHRLGRRRRELVEPLELLGGDAAAGRCRDARCRAPRASTPVELDGERARRARSIRVIIAS